jgi:Tol biopolymer transport system component
MTTNDADRRLSAWLETVAPAREPEHLLDAVLEQTARTSRRPAWRIPERWIPMTTITTPVTSGGSARWAVTVLTALLVLTLLAGTILIAGSRQPDLPAPFGVASNGLVVHDIDGDLVSVDPVTGASTVIHDAAGPQLAPTFSRDGTALAFLVPVDPSATEPAELELQVVNADGSGVRTLGTFTEPFGDWSPSGDRIVLSSLVAGEPAITIVDVASGSSTLLDLGMPAEDPVVRPSDPNQLAFRGRAPDGTWGLYLVRIDGGAPTRLDLDPGFELDRNYGINTDYYFLAPTWSPDGRRLAYHTLEESSIDPDPGFRVRVAEIDSGGALTGEVLLAPEPGIDDEFDAAWLPDGSGVVVHRVEEGTYDIVRWPIGAQLEATATPLVLDGSLLPDRFVIAPDGTGVLAWRSGTPAYILPLDGGPAAPTGTMLGEDATWQRKAP